MTAGPRLYADTSVFGGVFDERFAEPSASLLEELRQGRFQLVTSVIVQDEVSRGPENVQALFDVVLELAELEQLSDEALALQEAYVQAGIVTPRWAADALHVAIATVSRCSILVSWNFRHIVHFQKVPLYNAVNAVKGYPALAICSPPEVLKYGEREV